ncbi:nitroreductase [Rhodococcus sp. C26F]
MEFQDVMKARYSCRSFLPDELSQEHLERIFSLAQRAPSWSNTQPWTVHLTSGPATAAFAGALTEHVQAQSQSPDLVMPEKYEGVYAQRRRETGFGLYECLGIARDDRDARHSQLMLNYSFFGAPHVAVITSDRNQGVYGAIDCGAYVSALTLAATSLGVGSIAQAAIAQYSDFVRTYLGIDDDRVVVCAVALGLADPDHPANRFRTSRAPLDEVVTRAGA